MAQEPNQTGETPQPKKSSARTWVIFFVVLGVMAWWLVPDMMVSYKMYMNKAHNSFAKAELSGLRTACHAHWAKNDPDQECNVNIATKYGFHPNPKVVLSGSGTQTTFTATAQH